MDAIRITGKAYKALNGLTGSDEARRALTSVWAKGNRLYATDSYVVARYTFNNGDIGEEAAMLSEVIAKTAKAADDVTITDEGATICGKHGASVLTLPHDSEYTRMPNFDSAFDSRPEATPDETVVDPKLLERVAKLAKAVNGDMHMNSDRLRFFGHIEVDDGLLEFIIMGKNKKRG